MCVYFREAYSKKLKKLSQMISIIISTHNKQYFDTVSENITKTIGNISYEIVPIENHAQYSICQAYNMGVARAKYPYFVFLP